MKKIVVSLLLVVVLTMSSSFSSASQAKENEKEKELPEFKDLARSHWAYNDIKAMQGYKLVAGTDGNFYSEKSITRAEFVAILTRILELNGENTSFTDSMNHWASQVIGAAEQSGIIDKSEYGKTFEPNKSITRREMAKMISLAFAHKEAYKELLTTFNELYYMDFPFVDANEMDKKDIPYIAIAFGTGIIVGDTQDKFHLNDKATRAQATVMLYRFLKNNYKSPGAFVELQELIEVAKTGTNMTTISNLAPSQESYKNLVIDHPSFKATMKRLYVIPYENNKSLFEQKFVNNRNNIPAQYKGAQYDGIVVAVVDVDYKVSDLQGFFVHGQSLYVGHSPLLDMSKVGKQFGFVTKEQDYLLTKKDRKTNELVFYGLYGEDEKSGHFASHGTYTSYHLYSMAKTK